MYVYIFLYFVISFFSFSFYFVLSFVFFCVRFYFSCLVHVVLSVRFYNK